MTVWGKPLWSFYPCYLTIETEEQCFSFTSIIKFCSIAGSIETWGEQLRLYFWRYLVVACHKLSHYFNLQVTLILGFTWNCCRLQEAKKFSRNPGQSNCLTRETRYQVSRNSKYGISRAKLQNSPRPRTMLKILYFSGSHQSFEISLGIKSLYDRVEKLFIYWPGRHNFGLERQFQQTYQLGKSLGHLDRVLLI